MMIISLLSYVENWCMVMRFMLHLIPSVPWPYCQRSHRNVYIPACCSCLVATSYESGSNRMCDLHSLHLNPGPTSGIACRLMPHGGASRFIQISTLGLKKCEQMPHPRDRAIITGMLRTDWAMECFHMTSRQPYWCPKTMKGRPCWCPKPILWEMNSFLMQMISFVPKLLHRCWPREWKHSISVEYSTVVLIVFTLKYLFSFLTIFHVELLSNP